MLNINHLLTRHVIQKKTRSQEAIQTKKQTHKQIRANRIMQQPRRSQNKSTIATIFCFIIALEYESRTAKTQSIYIYIYIYNVLFIHKQTNEQTNKHAQVNTCKKQRDTSQRQKNRRRIVTINKKASKQTHKQIRANRCAAKLM